MEFIRNLGSRLLSDGDTQAQTQVQILSDLHLEVCRQYSTYTFPVSAPLLLLAGDIGRLIDYGAYLSFLQDQVARYRKVFLLLGNHEFYGLDYDTGIKEARRLAAEPSVASSLVLLHRTRWDDDESNLTILGCTLWSSIPAEAHEAVGYRVSDYREIEGWTTQRHNDVHVEELSWLKEQVNRLASSRNTLEDSRHILVTTHHAPCINGTSKPEYLANPWSSAFATDLLQNSKAWPGVKTWAFGHTHYSTDFLKSGIRVVSNQRGYVFPVQRESVKKKTSKPTKGAREFDDSWFIAL